MEDFYSYNIHQVIEELNDKKEELKQKGNTLLIPIIMFILGIAILLQNTVVPSEPIYILSTSFITLTIVAISIVVKNTVVQSTMKNKYLNQEVIRYYNFEQEQNAHYYPKYKSGSDFNKEMGLFTRFSSVSNKYMIKFDEETKILHTTIQTNNGKSNQVHFQGIYVIFEYPLHTTFQVRTNGKPHLKGQSFQRGLEEDIKVFHIEHNHNINLNYRAILQRLENYKKIYIASNQKEVHIAFTPFKANILNTSINQENFIEYYHNFEALLNTVRQLKDILQTSNI